MSSDEHRALRRLQAARHRYQHLLRDDAHGQRARRDQPVAGFPGLRLRPGARGSGGPRRCGPGTTSTRRCLASWRCARRLRPRSKSVTAPRADPATEVVVTSGATAGLYATLTALVHPGDEVLLFEPCYDSYVPVIRLSGGTPVFVSLRYPDYRGQLGRGPARHDAADTAHPGEHAAQSDRHRLDGGRHGPARRIVDGTQVLIVSDEVYEHIIFDGRPHESVLRYPDLRSRAVVISSFGKTFHTTGWKVGYAVAPAPLMAEVTASTSSSPSPSTRRRRSPSRSSSPATSPRTSCRRSTRRNGTSSSASPPAPASRRSPARAPTSR